MQRHVYITLIETLPPANQLREGCVFRVRSSPGVASEAYICLKLADNSYSWQPYPTQAVLSLKRDKAWQVDAITSSAQITTLDTAVDLSQFSFPIGANESWSAELHMSVTGSVGGGKFAFTAPTGHSTRMLVTGSDTSATTHMHAATTGSGTLSPAFVSGSQFVGHIDITLGIINGANAGTLAIQYASATAGLSTTVNSKSYMTARRIS